VDETTTHIEIDGEIVESYPAVARTRTCIHCTYPGFAARLKCRTK